MAKPKVLIPLCVLLLIYAYFEFLNRKEISDDIDVSNISKEVQVAASENMIFNVKSLGMIGIKELASDLKDTRIIVIGETHTNADHHRAQLLIIQALHEAGLNVSIGFEMFRTDAQDMLNSWVQGKMPINEFLEIYSSNWDRDLWNLYKPIFLYAKQEGIPMVGLNVSRSVVNQVSRQGFESLSDSQKKELGVLSCDVDPKYKNLISMVLGNKAKSDVAFDRFCEAQVVWDKAMGNSAIDYIKENPENTMVIIAGSFHAWKHGIAEQVERESGINVKVVLPSDDKSFFNYDILTEDADYVWWFD